MKDETIICISPEVWSGMWRERQQIMSRLAGENRIIFVEPARDEYKSYLNSLSSNLRNLPRLHGKSVIDKLTVYPGPPCLPYAATRLPSQLMRVIGPVITAVNARIMLIHLRRIMAKEGIREPILWFFGPSFIELVGRLDEKMVCYYVYDEIAEFERNARYKEFLQNRDRIMTREADVVFASSGSQFEKRHLLNPNTYFTPHGVDFEHYSKVLDPGTPIPDDVKEIKKPIVGYIGCLSGHLDAGLLLEISEKLSGWNVILVGPDEFPREEIYDRVKKRENIHILGRRDVSLIPNYIKAFDVAILPYRIIAHTKYAYPCKLHEYLASGKPIVASPLPELLAFEEIIEIAATPGEFIKKIGQLLTDDQPEDVEKRVAIARLNTWDQRVSVMKDAMNALLMIKFRTRTFRKDRAGKRELKKVGSKET